MRSWHTAAAVAAFGLGVGVLLVSRRRQRKFIGKLAFKDGQGRLGDYEGEIVGGMANGKGVWVCRDEGLYCPTYSGDFMNNQMHGHGSKKWETGQYAGNSHVGGFRHDKKWGPGKYTWANGDSFEGTWDASGARHGPGVYTHADGRVVAKHYRPVPMARRDELLAAVPSIRDASHAEVEVGQHSCTERVVPVALSGSPAEVECALEMINGLLSDQ